MAGGVGIKVIVKDNRFNAIAGKVGLAKRAKTQRAGRRLVDVANELTPVATGFLRSRNQAVVIDDGHVSVINDAPYAIYVHEGTYKMAARPWLAEAAEIVGSEYVHDWAQLESELT